MYAHSLGFVAFGPDQHPAVVLPFVPGAQELQASRLRPPPAGRYVDVRLVLVAQLVAPTFGGKTDSSRSRTHGPNGNVRLIAVAKLVALPDNEHAGSLGATADGGHVDVRL